MYILLVYTKELLKNDYLKTLLITIIKSLKKKKKKLFKNNLDRQKKLLLKFWLAHFPM